MVKNQNLKMVLEVAHKEDILELWSIWPHLSASCVDTQSKFNFVDDLTILEKIHLLMIEITSFNIKHQIPNDIPENNQNIPSENLIKHKNI